MTTVSAPLTWRIRWVVGAIAAAPFIGAAAITAIFSAPKFLTIVFVGLAVVVGAGGVRTARSFAYTHGDTVLFGSFPYAIRSAPVSTLSDCLLETLVSTPTEWDVVERKAPGADTTFGAAGHALGVRLEFSDTRIARVVLEDEHHAAQFADYVNTLSSQKFGRRAA